MGAFAQAGVPDNKAIKLMELDGDGLNLVDIRNVGDVSLVAAYVRRSTGVNLRNLTDAQVTGESVMDGGNLADTPVAPGSVILTATDINTLVDRDRDGILYLDRVDGAVLKTAADGVTSVPGTRTLTSATGDFINNGVVAGDQVVLTRKDLGSYTVVVVTATVLTLDANFPAGSNTAVTYFVKAVQLPAGTVDYFTGVLHLNYPSSPAAASPANKGSVLGTELFPINLTPGDTLLVDIDGGGDATATFDAAQAEINNNNNASVGPFLGASASETLQLLVDGVISPITFGAGTESTAAQYAAIIAAQLLGNGTAAADTNSLPAMIGSLNEMKAGYVAHGASATIHEVADAVNLITAADAADLATSETLANDIKVIYNAHLTQATVHINNDVANAVTAPNASNLATLVTLVADIKVQFNAHFIMDTRLSESIALANDAKAMYNAHRVLVGGGEHMNADSTNDVTAADGTNLATCITLANDIKTQYNGHLAEITTLQEAIFLLNDIKAQYEAHRILMASVHGNFDSIDEITAADATDLASAQTLANDLKVQYEAHRVHRGANATGAFGGCAFTDQGGDVCRLTDASNPFSAADVGKQIVIANSTSAANDGTFVVTAAAAGYVEYTNATLVAEAFAAATTGTIADVHGAADAINVVTAANAINLATTKTLANDLRTQYEAHRILTAGSVHGAADAIDVVSTDPVDTAAVHLIQDITNTIVAADATNLATLKTLLDEIRVDYELHRAATAYHGVADVINVITAAVIDTAAIHLIEDIINTIASMPDSVSILSGKYGTGASVQVVSGTGTILSKLGLVAGTATGTGDVADIDAITFAEAKAVIEADVADSLCQLDEGAIRITANSALVDANSTIQVSATSTAESKFGLDTTLHTGADPDAKQPISAAYTQSSLITSPGYFQQKVIGRNNDLIDLYFAAAGISGRVEVSVDDVLQ